MKKIIILGLIVLGGIATSCNKEVVGPNKISNKLEGDWYEADENDTYVDYTFESNGDCIQYNSSGIANSQVYEWKLNDGSQLEIRQYYETYVYYDNTTNITLTEGQWNQYALYGTFPDGSYADPNISYNWVNISDGFIWGDWVNYGLITMPDKNTFIFSGTSGTPYKRLE